MKVLAIYSSKFGYKPAKKTLDSAEEITEGKVVSDAVIAFIQVEETDESYDIKSREKKLVNHLKWVARKNNCKTIVLHSFAHLSESKATVDFTKAIFDQAETRLQNGGFTVSQTPFGYFLDLELNAPGFSLARIWASL